MVDSHFGMSMDVLILSSSSNTRPSISHQEQPENILLKFLTFMATVVVTAALLRSSAPKPRESPVLILEFTLSINIRKGALATPRPQ